MITRAIFHWKCYNFGNQPALDIPGIAATSVENEPILYVKENFEGMAAPLDVEFDNKTGKLYFTDLYYGYDEGCSGGVMEVELK